MGLEEAGAVCLTELALRNRDDAVCLALQRVTEGKKEHFCVRQQIIQGLDWVRGHYRAILYKVEICEMWSAATCIILNTCLKRPFRQHEL